MSVKMHSVVNMAGSICERKTSGAANGSAARIIKEESLSIVSGTFRSKPEHVDYCLSKYIHPTGCIRS